MSTQTNLTTTIPPEALEQVRCAFCATIRADQSVPVATNVAYMCTDCVSTMESQRKYPKWTHAYNTDTKKVVETEIDPADQGQNVTPPAAPPPSG